MILPNLYWVVQLISSVRILTGSSEIAVSDAAAEFDDPGFLYSTNILTVDEHLPCDPENI